MRHFCMLTLQNPPHTISTGVKESGHVKGTSSHGGNIAHGSVRILTSNHAPSTFEGFFMPKWKIIAHYMVRFIDGAF